MHFISDKAVLKAARVVIKCPALLGGLIGRNDRALYVRGTYVASEKGHADRYSFIFSPFFNFNSPRMRAGSLASVRARARTSGKRDGGKGERQGAGGGEETTGREKLCQSRKETADWNLVRARARARAVRRTRTPAIYLVREFTE